MTELDRNPSVRRRFINEDLGPLQDFKVMASLVWKHLKLPKLTPVQKEFCDYLQHGDDSFDLDDPGRNRQIIEAFRGVGKTWITATFVCWVLLVDADIRTLIVSKSGGKAEEVAKFIRRLIDEVPFLQHLDPSSTSRDTTIAFDVNGARPDVAPSVKALGIDGQLPGNRADIIIADDVETPQNSMTQLNRDRLSNAVKEFDAIVKPGGLVVYLGTPQVEDTLYNQLADRGYQIRIWPARYPTEKQMANPKYYNRLAPSIVAAWSIKRVWKVVDTARFTEEDLAARELSYGKAGFMLQFMLDTALADADRYPLKLRDLIVLGISGEKVPVALEWCNDSRYAIKPNILQCVGMQGDQFYSPIFVSDHFVDLDEVVMAVDPSGRGADETAYAIIGAKEGRLYCLASGGVPGGYADETLIQLSQLAAKHKVNRILPEANFGDGMFTALWRPVLHKFHACTIDDDFKVKGQKELRICDTLEPLMGSHRLVFLESVVRDDFNPDQKEFQLMYQMSRISRQRGALKHDDRIDALAMACGYFVRQMAQDVDDKEEKFKQARRLERLQQFLMACDALTEGSDAGSWRHLDG